MGFDLFSGSRKLGLPIPPANKWIDPDDLENTFRIKHPSTLQDQPIPERRWCIEGWIPDRAVTSLYGDGGTGKSLLAMQLMTAVGLGFPWCGMPTSPRKVLGVFCEDEYEELHRRQHSINQHYDIDFADLDNVVEWSSRVGLNNLLLDYLTEPPAPTFFADRLTDWCIENGIQLLVLDTAADLFSGREMDRLDVRRFISYLQTVAAKIDGAVVLLAHPSVTGLQGSGYSGSTAWNNSVRSRIYLEQDNEDRDARVLKRQKANYAGGKEEISIRYSDGVFLRESQVSQVGGVDLSVEVRFMRALDQALSNGERPSPTISARDLYAPRLLHGRPEVEGLSIRHLERCMKNMQGKGELRISLSGPPSQQKQTIVPANSRWDTTS